MGLAELRKQHGHTRREIAAYLGITEQAVINIERRNSTTRERLIALADFYDVSTDVILNRDAVTTGYIGYKEAGK